MKFYLSLIIIIYTFTSCNNSKESDNTLINITYELTNDNLKYFVKEYPNDYFNTKWYRKLSILDSLVNLEKNNKTISIEKLNSISSFLTKKMTRSNIVSRYLQDSLLVYNCKTYYDLLKLEYIIGNELIKEYNYFLNRAPYGKVTIEKDYAKKNGNVYFSIYDPQNNNYVVIGKDTIYSDDGSLVLDLEKYKKDTSKVKGSYFYYTPEYDEYTSMEFDL